VIVVAPPAVNPWDVDAVVEQALDVLRLDPADMDAERIRRKALEAVALIDDELDMQTPYLGPEVFPAPVLEAAVTLTVELYRRKDAPGGITDSWTSDGSFLRLSADVMKGVRSQLRPYKRRRGVA
jgi:hypothetical protein